MRLVWQLVPVAAVAFLGGQGVAAVQGDPGSTLAIGVLTAVLSVVGYRWVVGRTERRPVTELAAKGAGGAVWGTLLGAALFGAVVLNLAFLGYYEVHGLGSVAARWGCSVSWPPRR